ncbi:MAG: glycosyltransferase [Bacteroidales bacterium]
MENPLLSIITPVYNVAHYLPDCIESILAQQFTDFELILINDGSTDESGELCDRFAQRDTRIRVFHQDNRGLSGARNQGIDAARGEYIAFIDSDDTVSPDLFATNMKILGADPSIDLLEFPIFVYYGAPEAHLWRKGPHDFNETPFEEWFRRKGYDHTYACNKLFRSNLFRDIRFPEGKIFEDIFTIPKIFKECRHYYLSDRGIYYYHAREGSISRKESFEKYYALFESNYALWNIVRSDKALATDAEIFSLSLADWMVSMKRTDSKRTREVMQHYPLPRITPMQLLRLPMPLKRKLKNMPLVLFGSRIHCMIYTLIIK